MIEAINSYQRINFNDLKPTKWTYHGAYKTLIKVAYNRIRLLYIDQRVDSEAISKYTDDFVATLTDDSIILRSFARTMGVTKWKMYLKKNWKGLGKDYSSSDLWKSCFKAALTFDLSREFDLMFDGRCVL